jgi:predicted dehydrogenase
MSRKRIRIGVAGLGRIGWEFHCRQIAKHPAFELAAVQDVKPERRREAEETYGTRTFGDFSSMLDAAQLEAVVIATPTHYHKPMAMEAFRKGCHVFLEKPMAADGAEATAIVRAAKRSDRIVTVYQPRRACAYFQHAKKILASGIIGEVYHVRSGGYQYARRDDWQALRRFGGGMLNNYGAHLLDQILQLVGYDIKRVFANLRVAASLGDADDVVKVIVETRSGAIGEIDINQASTITPYILQVWGTRGALTLDGNWDQFVVTYFKPSDLPPKSLNTELASVGRRYPDDNIAFRRDVVPVDQSLAVDVYADLATAVRTGRAPFVKPEEPLAVMKLIDRCRENSGRVIKMKRR